MFLFFKDQEMEDWMWRVDEVYVQEQKVMM